MTRPARQPPPPGAAGSGPWLAGPPTGATGAPGDGGDGGDARRERDVRLAAQLAAAAAGDAGAFEAFYEATFAYARTVARRLLRNNAEIEDLLADCYFEAWRTAPRFDAARGSPVTWLLVLVRSRGLDALRTAAARPDRADNAGDRGHAAKADLEADTAPDCDDPAELLWRREANAELQAALNALSAPERWVLGLAYLRDLSHSEIARCTGMPLGTVKSHMQRAQDKLRARLGFPAARHEGAPHVSGGPR